MEDETINSAMPEVAPQESENHEQTSVPQEIPDLANRKKHDAVFGEMRRKQRELERDLQMQREMNEKLMKLATPQPKQEVDELDAIGDEEFIPKGKVNKLVEKRASRIAEEIAKRETEKFFQQQQQSQFMDRLKSKYADFEEVVNPETMAILEQQDPELATSIAELKDPYKIGMQCYKFMKALNVGDKVPASRRSKEIDKKLEQNEKTVQTPQAYDKRPMAQAFRMSKQELSNIYKEMMGYASGSY